MNFHQANARFTPINYFLVRNGLALPREINARSASAEEIAQTRADFDEATAGLNGRDLDSPIPVEITGVAFIIKKPPDLPHSTPADGTRWPVGSLAE